MYSRYLVLVLGMTVSVLSVPQAVALVLGLLVVIALTMAAYYAYKTRSKIWRHGKANICWERPMLRAAEGQDVQDWVSREQSGHIHMLRILYKSLFSALCQAGPYQAGL